MPVLEYNPLSLGSKNSIVYVFKQLVNSRLDTISDGARSTSRRRIAELDKELYDRAMSLPESALVSYDYIQDESKYQYGLFKGGNVYKSFDGQVDTSRQVKSQNGWIIRDSSSDKFCLFSNGNKSVIISLSDFEITPVAEDFTPLFNKLMETSKRDNNILSDTFSPFSLAVTYRFVISDLIINALYMAWLLYMGVYRSVAEFDLLINTFKLPELPNIDFGIGTRDPFKFADIAKMNVDNSVREKPFAWAKLADMDVSVSAADELINPSKAGVYELEPNVQAIIRTPVGKNKGYTDILYGYQQPDQVSYTASASFDPISPRGSQQPINFYQCANAISLNFTLKFHRDEVALYNSKNTKTNNKLPRTLQEVADLAENFTRPWQVGNSVKPKVVQVILPGISEIGYLTSANISYNGDMVGTSEDSSLNYSTYGYNTLEIGFELFIIKEVKLKHGSGTENITKKDITSDTKKDTKYTITGPNAFSASDFGIDTNFNIYPSLYDTSFMHHSASNTLKPGDIQAPLKSNSDNILNNVINVFAVGNQYDKLRSKFKIL